MAYDVLPQQMIKKTGFQIIIYNIFIGVITFHLKKDGPVYNILFPLLALMLTGNAVRASEPFEINFTPSFGTPDCSTDDLPEIQDAVALQVGQNAFNYTCR